MIMQAVHERIRQCVEVFQTCVAGFVTCSYPFVHRFFDNAEAGRCNEIFEYVSIARNYNFVWKQQGILTAFKRF